jgi:hypothetical protein
VIRSPTLSADLDRIVDFPWEVLEYLTWLRQRAASRDGMGSYLFDEPKVRFSPKEGDLLVAERDIRVRPAAGGLELSAPRAASPLLLDVSSDADRERVEGLLRRFDGQLPLAAVRTGLDAEQARVLDALLGAAFGKLIFAPVALLTAERAISGIEVTRFPGSPYEVERPYWVNMGAVRAASVGLWATLDDDDRFARALRTLHVILLMGEDLQSYYQPASPISSGRAAPGRFMLTAPELIDTAPGTVFVAGPRVSAALVGGPFYHELCCQTLGEAVAPLPQLFRDADGLDWGALRQARAAADASAAAWFCPPRPLRAAHLSALRGSLAAADAAARSADPKSCLRPLAAFHQLFVRLHPFHCGNQSLAMNLVNGVLSRALGAGMPHLFLDHLAIRLSREAYARVFRRAADAYVDPQPNVAARYLRLASNRTRTFALLRQLEAAASLDHASALARSDAACARLLLLSDA